MCHTPASSWNTVTGIACEKPSKELKIIDKKKNKPRVAVFFI
jgi:hypothetical protein